ncbi:hypothetical protein BJ165DRAFT_255148 [Panaeolus papilionaceus]|nr:hypothetical protein BJ165DRAFT_255148 [Panaeolus papilionaceus]
MCIFSPESQLSRLQNPKSTPGQMDCSTDVSPSMHKLTLQSQVPLSESTLSCTESQSDMTRLGQHHGSVIPPSQQSIDRVTRSLWASYGLSFVVLILSLISTFLHTHCAWLLALPAIVSTLSMTHSVALYGRIALSKPEERLAFFIVPLLNASQSTQSNDSSKDSRKPTSSSESSWSMKRFLQLSTWAIIWPMWVSISVITLIVSTTFGPPPNGHLPKVVLTTAYITCALSWAEAAVVFLLGWFIVRVGQEINGLQDENPLEDVRIDKVT